MCKHVCVKAIHQQHLSSYFLLCYLLVQLSFGPRCRLVSICNVVSCWRMPRTCESIARLEIEHKQRTKRRNLQHFALSDGKNPGKYRSFCPWKWIKHCYLQGFAHTTLLRFFEKHVNTCVFCMHQGKIPGNQQMSADPRIRESSSSQDLLILSKQRQAHAGHVGLEGVTNSK